MNIENLKLAEATMGSGLGRSEDDWKRRINWSCNTHMYRKNSRKLPVQLSLSQTSKTSCFSFIFYVFFFYIIRGQGGGTGLEGQLVLVCVWEVMGERGRRIYIVQIM
jgi:hypothetical protein